MCGKERERERERERESGGGKKSDGQRRIDSETRGEREEQTVGRKERRGEMLSAQLPETPPLGGRALPDCRREVAEVWPRS